MPYQTSNLTFHPTNPTLVKDVNVPREKGQTRVLPDGSLLYREPIMGEEVPAVRLEDIRSRLVQEASKKLSYRFPKKRGYEDTNVTAFVKKDYNYGPKRENRSDRLFQIQSDGTKGEKPDGYVMDGGRIVLDAFDHGLRNFGNQLPMYVSSELEGHDIEDYIRRNREISIYDLVARAPNGYYQRQPKTNNKIPQKDERAGDWHEGPPRVGTFSMRATRFRLGAGCLSWEKKDGTAAKNQRILDVIPAQYKDPAVNSTKGWRDLNKAELKKIRDGAMRKPQQGPKAKRAAQAEKVLEEKVCLVEDSAEREGFLEDGEGVEYQTQDAWNDAPNEQNNGLWPGLDSEGFESTLPAQRPLKSLQSSKGYNEISTSTGTEPSNMGLVQSRKRSRGNSDENSEESSNPQAQKRVRITTDAQDHGFEGGYSRIKTSRMGRLQQRRPAAEPLYIARGVSTHRAIDSSREAPHGNVNHIYNSRNTANELSPSPHLSNSNEATTYALPPHQLSQILPFEQGSTVFSAPLPHSTEQSHPQQHAPPPITSVKRKRTPSNSSSYTTSLPDEPHPNKRPKAHQTTQPTAPPQLQPPTDSAAPGAKPITPPSSYQIPFPPYHGQANTPHILFPPPSPPEIINPPESSQLLLPSAFEEEEVNTWIAETYPVVAEEYPPPPMITSHQEEAFGTGLADMDAYFPAFDARQIEQDAYSGSRGWEDGYQPADWDRGRWDGMGHDGRNCMQDG